jgi:ribosomal protein S18 acetylase RimI-like enzyme
MELKYREGHKEDREQLRALSIISYSPFQRVLTEDNWNTLSDKLHAESSYTSMLEMAQCYVCEVEDKIVGVAYLVPSGNPTEIFDTKWSYIRMVGVDPEFRGQGIAKKLTEHCIAFARQTDEEIIALHTSEFMDAARALYEALGFKRIKEIDPIFGKKYWLYQLELG